MLLVVLFRPLLTGVAKNEALFLFLQLVERQVVLFDALEEASFVRTHDLAAAGSVSHLIDVTLREARQADLGELLEKTATRVVLTAHPTQFYPDAVQSIIQDLCAALNRNDTAQVERLLLQMGKTRFSNRERPTPVHEARGILGTLEGVFYNVLPDIVTRILAVAHGRAQLAQHLPPFPNLQVGFWPGGDRDGNPFVTASVTLEVARLLKERVLERHYAAAGALARRLTFDGIHERMLAILERLRVTWLNATDPDDQHLSHATNSRIGPYATASELQQELLVLRDSITRDHQSLFLDEVDDFIVKVHLFGFHFASIDLRQSSDIFFSSLRELVEVMGAKLDLAKIDRDTIQNAESAQEVPLALLERILNSGKVLPIEPLARLSPLVRDTLEVLHLVPEIQQRNGELGLHRVIISHTRGPEDLLVVLILAQFSGLFAGDGRLDIVPLFESIEAFGACRGHPRSIARITGVSSRVGATSPTTGGDGGFLRWHQGWGLPHSQLEHTTSQTSAHRARSPPGYHARVL